MPYKNGEAKQKAHEHYINHKEAYLSYQKEYKRRTRLLAIEVYGGKCECCGESEPRFLCFDHINGGGGKMRRENKKLTGNGWYNFLIKSHPKDIRLLCHNCNMAYGLYGFCPHQENGGEEQN